MESVRKFTVIPAIDLKEGRCVRLRQGLATEQTVYSADPVSMAARWVEQGAEYLHVVDLDGAFRGQPVHTAVIKAIAAAVRVPIEVGGGLRNAEQMRDLLDAGAARVIIGTGACGSEDELARLAAEFGNRLAVGIDARDGRVRVKGWTENASMDYLEMARRAAGNGVKTIIYTNIATDGMLKGPDLAGMMAVCGAADCSVVASGGVSTAAHVASLRGLNAANLIGVIVGKALYEGTVTLDELLAAASGQGG